MTITIIDRADTLARFTGDERAEFSRLHAQYLEEFDAQAPGADRVLTPPYCEDAAQCERKAMCRALGLPGYTESIWSIDPTLNPVAVEEMMRLQYGTLNRLSHETFVAEAAMARAMEDEHPGSLAAFDITPGGGRSRAYVQAEKLVQPKRRIVVASTPRVALPPEGGGLYREPEGVYHHPGGNTYGRPRI